VFSIMVSLKPKDCCALALLSLLAFALAARHIGSPGLQYDELLFVNAAKGAPGSDLFIDARLFGIPVLLMRYIGALKAWVYHPIFAVFPVAAASVRLPSIIFGVTGALLLVAALGRMFGRRAVLLSAPIILLDPTILMQSRLDWGPNALMFLLRGALLFSLCSWIVTKRSRWIFLALLAAALGVFDKLNFLWLVYAAFASLILFFGNDLAAEARRTPLRYRLLVALALLLVVSATYRAMTVVHSLPTKTTSGIAAHSLEVLRLLALTLCGAGARDFVNGAGFNGSERVIVAWIILAGIAAVFGFTNRRGHSSGFLFVVFTLAGTAACMFLTMASTGVHHAALIAGLPQAAIIAFACSGTAGFPEWGSGWRTNAFALAVLLLASSFTASAWRSVDLFSRPVNMSWDLANQRAAQFATDSGEVCVVADWGLSTLLLGYGRNPADVLDAWQILASEGGAQFFAGQLDTGRKFEVLTRNEKYEFTPGAGARLLEAMRSSGWVAGSERTFPAWDGEDLIKVSEMRYRPGLSAIQHKAP
jgi:Dolichyl-phosphate-mannose-protein mannosyltransferase